MGEKAFVHIHNHTEFSLFDGLSRIKDMVSRAKELGMPAIAITDHGNMYGAIKLYKEAKKQGIKPIIGCEVYLTKGSRFEHKTGERERLYHLILLAKNLTGYQNLVKIVSKAYTEGENNYHKPRADHALLEEYHEGIIALSACIEGEIPRQILDYDEEGARKSLEWYLSVFGRENFYLEIQNHGLPEEAKVRSVFKKWAQEYGVKVVATNDFHYVYKEDAPAQEVKLCISTGSTLNDPNHFRFSNEEFYLKSREEMELLFADIPESLDTTLEIADKCNLELTFGAHHMPDFPVPEGETTKSYLRQLCEAAIPRVYGQNRPDIQERLEYELGIIDSMGFNAYFLIVWDYVRFAREHDILVGPGRGSAAGSIVAYLLGITGLDPLKYHLLFERFLNPERVTMPDIDMDFCYEKRGMVIDYVSQKYGADHVAQIITFGTLGAKAVLRDVGRVMDISIPETTRIVKMVPVELGITLTKAMEMNRELKAEYENNQQVRQMIDYGLRLEGLARHSSTHAAGIVISANPVDDYVPLQYSKEGFLTTQYDKDLIEELGLLKMDFLGLRTLTVIGDALELIRKNRGIDIDINQIPLDDEKACRLLCDGDTSGVFQMESTGITSLVKDLAPKHFEDLIPLVALYRPGPLGSGMVSDFIQGCHGEKTIEYLHPLLEPILKDTFGVILYQEQVMQIASVMGGFTFGQADLLRRAMGKKKEDVLLAQRETFLAGTDKNGIDREIANKIFDLMVYFSGYGFNKSHSAPYAYVAYQTAYLKAHYRPEFMAATMTSFMRDTEKLSYYIGECRHHGVAVLTPDINISERGFSVQGEAIRFGLSGVRNVGDNAIEAILREREKGGPFSSLVDFCSRIDLRAVGKRVQESLIKCGAMDSFGHARAQLMEVLPQAMSIGSLRNKDIQSGQMGLFDMDEGPSVSEDIQYPDIPEWPTDMILAMEKEYNGFYISGHPLDKYEEEMKKLSPISVFFQEDSLQYDGREVTVGGIILSLREILTRRNDKMAIIQIEDFGNTIEVILFPNVYRSCAALIQTDTPVVVRGRLQIEDETAKILAGQVYGLTDYFKQDEGVYVVIPKERETAGTEEALKVILSHYPGDTPVFYKLMGSRKILKKDRRLWVRVCDELKQDLEKLLGKDALQTKK